MNHDKLTQIALESPPPPPPLLATQASIGLDNGLVPTMRLAIIWTNSGQVYWRIHAHCRLNEVKWVKYSWLPRINSSLPYNKHVCRHSSWVASPKANLHVKAGLVQEVEWPRTGVKPLSEPMSTVFLRSNLSMSWIELPSLYNRHGLLCINKCVCTLKVILMDMY